MAAEAEVELLDELALTAWAPAVRELLDGWVLGYGYGISGRANSVWANGEGTLPLEKRIDDAERWYGERGVPPRFMISPASKPAELDDVLAGRGYEIVAPTLVQTASIAPVEPDPEIVVVAQADDAWLDTWLTIRGFEREPALAAAEGIFSAPGGFARFPAEGKPIAIGRAVPERGWVGIFAMQTLPEARRQGFARRTLQTLLRWGLEQGATRAYLQVEEANERARPLYASFGFSTRYAYHYRRL